MICPKCECENKQNYCIKCGAMLTKNGINQIHVEYKENEIDQLQKILGYKADTFIAKPRNWAAGFFGPFYLIYRRCYIQGACLLTISCLLFFISIPIMNNINFLLFYLMHFILYTIYTNSYYMKIIKEQLNNPKVNKSKLGTTNIIAVFLFLVFVYLSFNLSLFLK